MAIHHHHRGRLTCANRSDQRQASSHDTPLEICVHEAGHLMALAFCDPLPTWVRGVIIANGCAWHGEVTYATTDDQDPWNHLLVVAGGLAAEIAAFGNIHTRPHDDLASLRAEMTAMGLFRRSEHLFSDGAPSMIDVYDPTIAMSTWQSLENDLLAFFKRNAQVTLAVAARFQSCHIIETEAAMGYIRQGVVASRSPRP